jgi:hypothetical protein
LYEREHKRLDEEMAAETAQRLAGLKLTNDPEIDLADALERVKL